MSGAAARTGNIQKKGIKNTKKRRIRGLIKKINKNGDNKMERNI